MEEKEKSELMRGEEVMFHYSGSHLKATIVKEGHIGKMKSVVPKKPEIQLIKNYRPLQIFTEFVYERIP
jgi:hypothetical protein